MAVEFNDNRIKVKQALVDKIEVFLVEASSEIQSAAQRNTPVQTGQLKGSWQTVVDMTNMEATIGTDVEYSIWVEFGTGQYALNGDGRKTPWFYVDDEGKGHKTSGQKPKRMLHNAFESNKRKIQARFEAILKGLV